MAVPKPPAAKRKRTQADRNLDAQCTLRDTILGIFAAARRQHCTHAQMLDVRASQVYAHPSWAKLSAHNRTYLNAYWHGHSDALYADALEWRVLLDGKLVASADVPNSTGAWARVGMGAHVWKADPTKLFYGTPEPRDGQPPYQQAQSSNTQE